MAKRLNKNVVGGLTALAFVVITAAGVFMVSALRKVDPEQHAQKAARLAGEGDYEKAAIYYGRAFQVSEPKDPKYLVQVGNMWELNGDEQKAVGNWLQAKTMDPTLLEAQEKILSVYQQMMAGPLQIKEVADGILKIQPKNPKALHALGIALIQLAGQPMGDREKGFASLEEAHALAPEVYDYTESLVVYYWNDAASLAEHDADAARQRVADALGLAKALVEKNQTRGKDAAHARTLYGERLSTPVPQSQEAVFLSAINKHVGGDRYAAAEKLLQEAIEMAGDDAEVRCDAMTALATYWFRRSVQEKDTGAKAQQIEKAQTLARQAIEVWNKNFGAYLLLAQIHANSEEPQKAAEVCAQRASVPIDRKGLKAGLQKRNLIRVLMFEAEQYVAAAYRPDIGQGSDAQLALAAKAEQAVVDAQAEVPDAEQDPLSLHLMGKVRLAQGKEMEALSYFERADRAAGGANWQNKHFLGVLRMSRGQLGGAREALTEATRDPRAGAATWMALARVYVASDEPEIAIVAADEALKRQGSAAEAIQLKIAANQKLGRQDVVEKLMQELEGAQASGARPLLRIQLLLQQGKYAEAFEALKAVLTQNPDTEGALRLFGAVAAKIEKQAEALEFAKKLSEAHPDNLPLKDIVIGLTPDLTDDQRNKLRKEVIEKTDDAYTLAIRMGEFYKNTGKMAEAMEQFGKAADLVRKRATPNAQKAGPQGLLFAVERQFGLALQLEAWDKADAIVQVAIEENLDGAHGMTFRGRAAMVRKQYDAATEALKQAATEQPSQGEVWTWLGECHFQSDRKGEARAAFTRAAELNPDSFMAQRRLAQFAKDAGDSGEFNLRLDRCVQLAPDDPWVRQQETVRQEEKDPKRGIDRRETLRQQDPNDLGNLVQLARLYELTKNVEKATEVYDAALGQAGAPPGVAWRAASFYLGAGNRERAFEVLAQARERATTAQDKAAFLLMAGNLHQQLGEQDLSEQQFRKAADEDPSENTFVAFADYYQNLKKYPSALEWFDKAVAAADKAASLRAPTIRRQRYSLLLQMNDRPGVEAAVKDFRERYPKDPTADLMESEWRAVLGEIDEAVASLTQYLQKNPSDPLALYRRAQHYAGQQKWQAAIKDLEDLRAVKPDALDFAPRILLAQAYDLTDRKDLAQSELKTLYETHPGNDMLARHYFQYFMKHERYADAEALATALVNREADNPAWHLVLGQAAARNKDWVKALASFRDAAEKSDYDWRYCNELLGAYAASRNWDAGIKFYEEVLPPDKRRSPGTYRYASLLAAKGRTEEAVTAFRQALVEPTAFRDEVFVMEVATAAAASLSASQALTLLRKEPSDETLRRANQHLLVPLLVDAGQRAEAVTILDALINTSTDDREKASLYCRKGILAQADKAYDVAQQAYEQTVKLNPDHYLALNNLAYLLADTLKKPTEAVPYAERAVQLSGQRDIVDTLAWTLVQTKQYGRAIGLLTGLAQRDPEFITGLVHLAEAYRRTGKFDAAVVQFEQAMKLIEQTKDNENRELAEKGLQLARDKKAEP